jgi:sugar phosphate isomerase/epimerase
MKFGICNEIFHQTLATPWTLEKAMAFAAKVGYDAIEIAPFTLAPTVGQVSGDQRRRLRDAAAEAGLAISGIHWVLVQTEGLHVTHPDAAVRRRTAVYICQLADVFADLGGRSIIVGAPTHRSVMEGVEASQAWDWAREVFGPGVARAAERDVVICLEPLAPSETNFINTAAEAVAFVDQWTSPHFQIILDVKAMSSESKPIPQIIRERASRLGY